MAAPAPGAPPAGAMPMPPGPTGPATVAPDRSGLKARAAVKVNLALTLLNQAIMLYGGSMDDDGRELMTMVAKMSKRFGPSSPDLNRQEVKMLGQQAPPIQSAAGGGGMDLAAMIKQRLASMPGAAPTGG